MSNKKHQIEKLIDGSLSWQELRNDVLPDPKDDQRFEVTRQVLQENVDWEDTILVPLNDHLYVVGTEDGRRIKAECGHELCDADENWKMHCEIRVRESPDELQEIYTDWMSPDEDWAFQLREYFCPNCYEQLDVEAVPAGYPILQKFEPDIDAFYEKWTDKPAPDKR